MSKGWYVDGKMNGLWEHYYENSSLNERGCYRDGYKDGYWEVYYSNGHIMYRGRFVYGNKEGYWEVADNKYDNNIVKCFHF